ncbi:hypothetical protein BD311DRAFT_842281, partial [Dichomitus squalens]
AGRVAHFVPLPQYQQGSSTTADAGPPVLTPAMASAGLQIDTLCKTRGCSSDSLYAARYTSQQGRAGVLADMVYNHAAMASILRSCGFTMEDMKHGDSCCHIQGITLSCSNILANFGWQHTTFKKGIIRHSHGQRIAATSWPVTFSVDSQDYVYWQDTCYLWSATGPLGPGYNPASATRTTLSARTFDSWAPKWPRIMFNPYKCAGQSRFSFTLSHYI